MSGLAKILLIFILFINPALHSQDTNIVKYFPLSVGNVWVYYGSYFTVQCQSSYYQKISVDSIRILNNHKYYKLSLTTRFISGSNCGYSQIYNGYYRVDSSNGNVYRYGINTNCSFTPNEFLIDSLRSRSGDTSILCSNSELSRKIARDTIVQNIFSFNRPSKYFEGGNFHEYGFFTRYVKDIGISNMSQGGISLASGSNLMGCLINGILYGDTNYFFVGIQQISVETPRSFGLSQNYPNPFNPVTKIKFSISGKSVAQTFLSVFDVLGNEVAVIVNQNLKPGIYETDWDASTYPSGVYFYELKTNSFKETKKMILLK